jgi:peptide/nickel transport system permease protein
LFKYPVRLALNPMISTIGWLLPTIVSGEALVSIVLNMPTTGPLLLKALLAQDMYLAGSILLVTSALTVIGTLLSDILLAWLDPRIRFGGVTEEG